MNNIKLATVNFSGGLNVESPHASIPTGMVTEAENMESNLSGGYRLVSGYERHDGRAAPSAAVFYSLTLADASGVSVGDSITGGISGATANVIAKDDDGVTLGITNLTGNFVLSDGVGSSTVTVIDTLGDRDDPLEYQQWTLAAANYYRSLILPLSGTGATLGVWEYNGKEYGFRENGGVIVMYETSASGWVAVTMYSVLNFDAGTGTELVVGDTINGATSAATGIIKNSILTSGTWGVDAAGYFVIDVTSGTFQDNEPLRVGADPTSALAAGADAAISLSVGTNNFKFVNYNFYGNSGSVMMYGCDGVNNSFQFDGAVFTPIYTGMTVDAPLQIEAHNKHLMLGFSGGSLQHSGVGDPLSFSPILGASEIGLGSDIGSLKSIVNDVMMISTATSIYGLYGSSSADWTLKLISTNTGDVGDTLDVIGGTYMTTVNGLTRVDSVQAYGNFQSSTVSRAIRPLLDSWLNSKTLVGTTVSRAKNQYRLHFSDGSVIIAANDMLYGEGQLPYFTTMQLGKTVACVSSTATTAGGEVLLMGDADGYVYKMNVGHDFDGENIEFALRLPFVHLKSPSVRKAFKRYELDLDVDVYADIRVSYEFSYGNSHTRASELNEYSSIGSGGYWGATGTNWSEFNWSSEEVAQIIETMSGTGQNVSFLFYGKSNTNSGFTLNGLTLYYLARKLNRS